MSAALARKPALLALLPRRKVFEWNTLPHDCVRVFFSVIREEDALKARISSVSAAGWQIGSKLCVPEFF